MIPPVRILHLAYKIAEDHLFNLKRKVLPFPVVTRRKRDVEHSLQSAMEWLMRSVMINKGNGSSGAFSYVHGWKPPFPETTGYIAKTFFEYSLFADTPEYEEKGLTLLDFLCDVQGEDGGVMQGLYRPGIKGHSIIFNTGMAMLGWLSGYRGCNKETYRGSLVKAGDFLASLTESEELWLKHSYNNIYHTYHTRVAWPLLDLGLYLDEPRYVEAAEWIYDWTLQQQLDNGYFKNCFFETERPTYNTHAFAYTIRGFLEGYLLNDNSAYLEAAMKTSEVFLAKFESEKRMPTLFNEEWKPEGASECLTGIAQHSIIWMKLYRITDEIRFLNAAFDATDLLCAIQKPDSFFPEVRGAVKGSHPIWGRYASLSYPNWATKFFADALMLRISITEEREEKRP